ncbi:MAG: hypothetical protein TREMPRED_002057, partial [Tremellales sp. Tagirdzhanova-0007]
LVFIHLDPVLAVHLGKQSATFLGRGVIEFIHPAEREQARQDLAHAISLDDLQGSVTRMRFARLSRIRTALGCPPGEVEIPHDAGTFVEDEGYVIADLVLNWVADGLLLAFFHAIRDKDPIGNNDPNRQHEEWSNFCGTTNMSEDQIEALHVHISSHIPLPPPSRFPPIRVFQLHIAPTTPTGPSLLVFSWPPPRPNGPAGKSDGLYEAEAYSDLMRGVDMDPNQLAAGPDDIRTSCTTRFGAKHSITTEGTYRHVTSVFIPYGSLIFSCFQTTKQMELSPRSPGSYALMTPQQGWTVPPNPNSNWSQSNAPWKRDRDEYEYEEQMAYPGPHPLSFPSPHPQSQPRPPPGPHPQPQSQPYFQSQHQSHSHPRLSFLPQTHVPPPSHPQTHRPLPRDLQTHRPPSSHAPTHTPPHEQSHLPPYVQTHPQSRPPSQLPQVPDLAYGNASSSIPHSSDAYGEVISPTGGPGSRPLIRPPGEVDCCRLCGLRESPEWRRSETGVKDLCNACGLRLARQVAKREGRQKPRKKKDKE